MPKPRRARTPRSGVRYLTCRVSHAGVLWRWTPTRYLAAGWPVVAFRDGAGRPLPLREAAERAAAWNDVLDGWRRQDGPGAEAFAADASGWPRLDDAARPKRRGGARTLNDVAHDYRQAEAFGRVSAAQRRQFKWSWTRLIQPALGDLALAAVTPTVAQALVEALAREGRGARSVQQAQQTGSRLMSHARRRGWAGENPFQGLDFARPEPRIRIVSWTEEAAILAAVDRLAMAADVGLAVLLAVDTGQRLGDLRHAGLADVAGAVLHVRQNKAKRRNDVVRVEIPLSERLAAAVQARRRRQVRDPAQPMPADYLLIDAAGKPYGNPRPFDRGDAWDKADQLAAGRLDRRWRKVRAEASRAMPSVADVQFRDWRDTAVTRLADAGCTIPEIAAFTGHSIASIHAILRHYLAATAEQAATGAQKLAALHRRNLEG